jgi:hypothetical protein
MRFLDELERRFGRFALPNLTVGLVSCQVAVYGMALARPEIADSLTLVPEKVLEGQVWRLATFLVVPPVGPAPGALIPGGLIILLFFWYLFYLMGTSLQSYWGAFRYNLYLLIGWMATAAVAFVDPSTPATNGFLQTSVFLAFAFLCPDFELYIMFLLPLRIKWLALLTWLGYGWTLIFSEGWLPRVLILASVCNFLLFFGHDIVLKIRYARRHMAAQANRFADNKPKAFHRCLVCGITDLTHPKMEFRYCSKCAGTSGYCTEHLHNHEHVVDMVKQVGK